MQLIKLEFIFLSAIVAMTTFSLGCRVATSADINRAKRPQLFIRSSDTPAGTVYVRSTGLDKPSLSAIFYSKGNKVRIYSDEKKKIDYLFTFTKQDGSAVNYVASPLDFSCFINNQPAAGDIKGGVWAVMRDQ